MKRQILEILKTAGSNGIRVKDVVQKLGAKRHEYSCVVHQNRKALASRRFAQVFTVRKFSKPE